MLLRASHRDVEQPAALFVFTPAPFLAQGALVEIVLVLTAGRIAPARAKAVMPREGHHGNARVHAFVHGGHEDHGELQTLGRVHRHDLHCVGGIFRRGVGFARVFLAHQGQFGDKFIERHAPGGVAGLRQEFVQISRVRVAAIVDGGKQKTVESDVLASLTPFVQTGGETGEPLVVLGAVGGRIGPPRLTRPAYRRSF